MNVVRVINDNPLLVVCWEKDWDSFQYIVVIMQSLVRRLQRAVGALFQKQ